MPNCADDLTVCLEADLYAAGWNGALNPYPGVTPKQHTMISLRKALVKKFVPSDTTKPDQRALELFRKVNSTCKGYTPTGSRQLSEVETIALGESKEFLSRFFSRFDPVWGVFTPILDQFEIATMFGFGPGASIGSPSEDLLTKVGGSTMAATDRALHAIYMQAVSEHRVWADVESIRLVNRGCEIVQGSRLSFVPKSAEISRTICTEPLLNMMFQKGIGSIITQQLRWSCGIDLRSQQFKNRILARLGSETGRFGTIDLSSASDSMSLGLVNEFFPSQVVHWLELCRSPVTILPDGSQEELHMVSSMGNGFTFPLQTLFFLSLVYGAYRVKGLCFDRPSRQSLGNFAVFGDDIIVVKEAYDLVVKLLSLCGFSVNVDKSFNEGFFRESCGGDYYLGHNVRGVYIQHLDDMQDKFSAINRLNDWSARHGVLLYRTISWLSRGVHKLYVPLHESETAGIRAPLRAVSPSRVRGSNGAFSYRYYHDAAREVNVRDQTVADRRICGGVFNPSAILLSALAGALRSGKVVFRRTGRRLTRVRRRESPCWDSLYVGGGENRRYVDGWKAVYEMNLDLS